MGLLTGKNALVVGVANPRSIAWGIAQAFHEHGARLAFTCLESTHRRVVKLAGEVDSGLVFPCDVAKDEDVTRTFEEVGKAFDGRLDVLVHSVAFARLDDMSGEFINVSREGWRLALDVSAYSLVAIARAARPLMKAAGGSIMTMTFSGGGRVAPGYNIMGVAKAALEAAVRYLAAELGPKGIRVHAISPGPLQTRAASGLREFDALLDKAKAKAPAHSLVSIDDVGVATAILAHDAAKLITGDTIFIDGGYHIVD